MTLGLCSLAAHPARASETMVHEIRTSDELGALAPLLASVDLADKSPLLVRLAAGTYVLQDSIRILRSGVTLTGDPGAKLVLASGVNEPVIAIGTQAEVPSATAQIHDITIAGLEIDGNMDGQSSETSLVRPWIRNNGIDARAVARLTVEDVVITQARSGGIVISWKCSDVRVQRGMFAHNFFDGLAFYDSERVSVTDCTMEHNRAAGISLDNDFRDSVFSHCIIRHNGDVGIFARNTHDVRFESCTIETSGNWAAFLGHDESDHGVTGIRIEACQIRDNRGGIFLSSVNEQQSTAVNVSTTAFAGNLVEGRTNWYTCGAPLLVSSPTEESAPSVSLPLAAVPLAAW